MPISQKRATALDRHTDLKAHNRIPIAVYDPAITRAWLLMKGS